MMHNKNSHWLHHCVALAFLVSVLLSALDATARAETSVRIKDIVTIQGMRSNQLIGYGLVVGLNGTGDGLRNSPFTESSMKAMLDQMGVGQSEVSMGTKNVAAVIVTADMTAFSNPGTKLDATVSSIGDASSLRGGTLLFTPLYGGDGELYAAAQGALVVNGFTAEGDAAETTNNTPTTGKVPNGAVVEFAAPGELNAEKLLVLQLVNPDFDTVVSVTDVINQYTTLKFGRKLARERDSMSIEITPPTKVSNTRFFSAIGKLNVKPDTPAKIVINERTGTVIIGSNVRISQVAITHGGLTVSIDENPIPSQPSPFSRGETVVTPSTFVDVAQDGSALGIVEGPNLQTLVHGLNLMGAKPSGIIAILQGIKSAGAIHADIVVQ